MHFSIFGQEMFHKCSRWKLEGKTHQICRRRPSILWLQGAVEKLLGWEDYGTFLRSWNWRARWRQVGPRTDPWCTAGAEPLSPWHCLHAGQRWEGPPFSLMFQDWEGFLSASRRYHFSLAATASFSERADYFSSQECAESPRPAASLEVGWRGGGNEGAWPSSGPPSPGRVSSRASGLLGSLSRSALEYPAFTLRGAKVVLDEISSGYEGMVFGSLAPFFP